MRAKKILRTLGLFIVILLTSLSCATGDGTSSDISETAHLVLGQSNFESATNNAGASAANEASSSSLSAPQGIFFDGTRLYIADTHNNRVLVWSTNPSTHHQAADIVLGQPNTTDNHPNQGQAADCATLSNPTAVHVNGNRLFVADSGNNRVLIYNDTQALATGVAADRVIGHSNCTETRQNQLDNLTTGVRSDTLSNPTALFYDGDDIYIADTNNHRVLIYDGLPVGHGHRATVVIGQATMEESALKAVAANTFNNPGGIYVTKDKLLVSDSGYNRILIFNTLPTTDNASANVVIGQPSFTSSSAGTSASTLSSPGHIHGDNENKIAIADMGNHRVLIYTGIPLVSGTAANHVLGQPNFTSSGTNRGLKPDNNTLNAPQGIFTNGTVFWIADTLNHRALKF